MSQSWLGFFLIALRSTLYRYVDRIYALYWYCKCPNFFKVDARLHWRYVFTNPYKVCRKHWGAKYTQRPYGETPLKTLADIAAIASIQPSDTVLELGCGRGRGAFWLASCVGCKVIAIDAVPHFIQYAREIAKSSGFEKHVTFYQGDFFQIPLEEASVIYLYGTGLEESIWFDLTIWLSDLPKKPLIITVSYPLQEFSPHFALIGQCDLEFGWGKAKVYLQKFQPRSVP